MSGGHEGDSALPITRRDELIRTAVYFGEQHRGFAPGEALEDWREIKPEVDRWIEIRGRRIRSERLPPRLQGAREG